MLSHFFFILQGQSQSPNWVFWAAAVTAMGIGFYVERRKKKMAEQRADSLTVDVKHLQQQLEEYKLERLKFQLSPHTVINSISTLSNYASKTVEGLDGLNQIMSFLLYEGNKKFVTLEEEWKFLDAFLRLHKLKVNPLVTIKPSFELSATDPLLNKQIIPPFLTAYFVENAFKHGDKTAEGHFSISLKKVENKLVYLVTNKVETVSGTERKSGIGQKNLEERMKILYPNRYKIEYKSENGYYHSTIELHLQ